MQGLLPNMSANPQQHSAPPPNIPMIALNYNSTLYYQQSPFAKQNPNSIKRSTQINSTTQHNINEHFFEFKIMIKRILFYTMLLVLILLLIHYKLLYLILLHYIYQNQHNGIKCKISQTKTNNILENTISMQIIIHLQNIISFIFSNKNRFGIQSFQIYTYLLSLSHTSIYSIYCYFHCGNPLAISSLQICKC